jgi:hypothetical protein
MSRVLLLATQTTRSAGTVDLLRGAFVGGCALALILARTPLGI